MMRVDAPHLSLKDILLNVMVMSSWIAVSMCLSVASVVMWGFLQVDYLDVPRSTGLFRAILVHFMVPRISSSLIVGVFPVEGLKVSHVLIF